MFADPQSVTINTVAKSLARTGASLNAGRFATPEQDIVLSVNQSSGRRVQHRVRLDNSKIVTDPLASDRNLPVSMSCYIVVDMPVTGYSGAEAIQQVKALADWLKASTNADKLIGNEV